MIDAITPVPTVVKWAGGKRRQLWRLNQLFPESFNNYLEPFVGGGAVAFHLLQSRSMKKVYLSDINKELINAYQIVKDDVGSLIVKLSEQKMNHSREHYYAMRAINPEGLCDIHRAARFIYLNKTCFNGLYRVNKKGKFNVPIGSYKNPNICSAEGLQAASRLLQDVTLFSTTYEMTLGYAQEGDFVYLDPPYYPLNDSSFTAYSKEPFGFEQHKNLAKAFYDLHHKGCKVMLSNSDTNVTRALYFMFEETTWGVDAARAINSKAEGRGVVSDMVVTNYEPGWGNDQR